MMKKIIGSFYVVVLLAGCCSLPTTYHAEPSVLHTDYSRLKTTFPLLHAKKAIPSYRSESIDYYVFAAEIYWLEPTTLTIPAFSVGHYETNDPEQALEYVNGYRSRQPFSHDEPQDSVYSKLNALVIPYAGNPFLAEVDEANKVIASNFLNSNLNLWNRLAAAPGQPLLAWWNDFGFEMNYTIKSYDFSGGGCSPDIYRNSGFEYSIQNNMLKLSLRRYDVAFKEDGTCDFFVGSQTPAKVKIVKHDIFPPEALARIQEEAQKADVPKLSVVEAYACAVEALGTNAVNFVAVGATPVCSAANGGWEFLFWNQNDDSGGFIHINDAGAVERRRNWSYYAEPESAIFQTNLPTLSLTDAFTAAAQFDPTFVVTTLDWNSDLNLWIVKWMVKGEWMIEEEGRYEVLAVNSRGEVSRCDYYALRDKSYPEDRYAQAEEMLRQFRDEASSNWQEGLAATTAAQMKDPWGRPFVVIQKGPEEVVVLSKGENADEDCDDILLVESHFSCYGIIRGGVRLRPNVIPSTTP